MAFVHDPEGNLIELLERTELIQEVPNGVCADREMDGEGG
jgi:hypothetical protein